MTTPEERTRALVWAGGFLIELARDESLPLTVRQQAVVIARHFPTIEEVSAMALFHHPTGLGMGLDVPDERVLAGEQLSGRPRYGPLRYSTRLAWPEG
jgi:hypothetical protein